MSAGGQTLLDIDDLAPLNQAYLRKESFGQLWDYDIEGCARRFFDTWRASLKRQRLTSFETFAAMIDRH